MVLNFNALKQVDIKKNLRFILFFLILNYLIVMNGYQFLKSIPYEQTSDFYIDGTNFSFFSNALGIFLNLALFIMNYGMTFFTVLVATIIFNKLYFKSNTAMEMDKRIKDIKIIALLISALSICLLLILNKNQLAIYALIHYLPFPFIIYFVVKYKIKKLYKNISA